MRRNFKLLRQATVSSLYREPRNFYSPVAPIVSYPATPQLHSLKNYVGASDQGTTSTRFMVCDQDARVFAVAQKEHRQIYPQPGWGEHDPLESRAGPKK